MPQWTFLRRLFPEVVLQDAVAVAASRGGPQAALRRRALLASVAGLAGLLGRLDLVSREEFDVQAQVLARTREDLKALEERLARLEGDSPTE